MNKSQSQKIHAKNRLQERFDLQINRHEMRDLVDQIQSNLAVHLETQSNRTSVKMVMFKGKELPVVYDNQRKTIVTFLPEEVLEKYRKPRVVYKATLVKPVTPTIQGEV